MKSEYTIIVDTNHRRLLRDICAYMRRGWKRSGDVDTQTLVPNRHLLGKGHPKEPAETVFTQTMYRD